MTTGFVWHERYMWHDTGMFADFLPAGGMSPLQPYVHIENADAKRRFKNLLDVLGVTEQLTSIKPRFATEADLARVHTKQYIEQIQELSATTGGDAGGGTPFAAGGYEIACLAAGGLLALIDAILDGEVDNGYALVRPPGHHAERDTGWGFCIFNNNAIGVQYARQVRGVGRVAILDWDVHHGNGTQNIFYEDPDVLTISLHQAGAYPPDSGRLEENGAGAGQGTNINVNIPAGAGHAAYLYAMEQVVIPALHRFQPEFIAVSSGFDAGGFDPLARMLGDGETFRAMTSMVKAAAATLCSGRLALVHEGGYAPTHVPFLGLAVIEELSGIQTGVVDPFAEAIYYHGGHTLLPHQAEAIAAAAQLVELIPLNG
ncbi:MAG: class II histone deacetylase [Anaerolineales bacterium]|nr:class II histone deacetylase [Anaerolineales bacterium]